MTGHSQLALSAQIAQFCVGRRRSHQAATAAITAVLEREASLSTSAQPSPTLGVVKVAVRAAGPGRVAEQRVDAGGGAGLTQRLVPQKTGNEGGPAGRSQCR
jgi:hypothetical protein